MDLPNFTGFRFVEFPDPLHTGLSVLQYGVYDGETGDLIGITVKIGEQPMMMFPVLPIPPGAVRFDEDRPSEC